MDYKSLAAKLGIKEAVLRAVVDVESQGDGFLPDGKPKILFEPHIFWKQLKAQGIDPNKVRKGNEDILYPTWQQGKYGKVSEQHTRLNRAMKINAQAAFESASYGAYQILGNNWKSLGYLTYHEFVADAYTEEGQIDMFTRFLKINKLIPSLQKLDFNTFALKYNGAAAAKNKYGEKINQAYKLWEDKLKPLK